MNRIFSIFIVIAVSCTYAFAQQSTNIVGSGSETIGFTNLQFSGSGEAPDNYAANVENVAELNIVGSTFEGGVGGTTITSETIIEKNGGTGLQLKDIDQFTFSNSKFDGGKGGQIDVVSASSADGRGGHGINLLGDFTLVPLGDGVVAIGGEGGAINIGSGRGKSFGGDGINWVADLGMANSGNIMISGGSYQGGNGGTAIYNSDEKLNVNSDIAYFGNVNGARGGHGLWVSNQDYLLYGTTVTIDGGSFVGGNGGTAQNSGSGDVFAHGGHGLFVDFADLVINGGEFTGGSGGSENGTQGAGGYGVRTRDSNLTITDGMFQNQGLFFESHYYDTTASISGGAFGEAVFTATFDEFFGHPTVNTINISGGTFESVLFNGEELNNATITGGTIASLVIEGTGNNDLSFSAPATISKIIQNGGTANVNQWADQHFMDTTISSGTMNFNNQLFTLGDGSSFALLDQSATVNFNDGLLAKSNSAINIVYDGTSSTAIEGTGLTFEEGVNWTVDGGATAVANGDTVVMAIDSAPSLVASTNVSYVNYVGSGGSWMGGITSLEATTTQLIGTYGFVSLNKALGTTPGTDYDTAMTDLTAFLGANDFDNAANYTEFKGMGDAADVTLTEAYVRTPEMASTLMQLQGVFADQIKDRTRSNLRQQEWGVAAGSTPQGAQGPGAWDNSMDWLNDHLPKWDARDAVGKDTPPKAAEAHAKKAPRDSLSLPATYQVWGRAYGARIEQDATTGFGGYNANIGGGVLGIDKRFNNMLLGLGGGYSHTTVDGNWGSNGEADTGYGTVYAAVTGGKAFFDFNVNLAFNDVETESSQLLQYTGDYTASSAGFYLGGGYGMDLGKWLFTPEASLLTTYYDRDSYTETSSATAPEGPYPDKEWDAYSQWSYLSSLGATLSMVGQIDNFRLDMEFRPEVRLHWLHEFNADLDNPTYIMQGGIDTIGVSLQAREEDLIKVGTGIRFSKWDSDTLEFGLDLDGAFGQDYAAYILSGKLMHRF